MLPNSCPVPSQAAQSIDSVHEDSKPVALHAGQRVMFASMNPAVGYKEENQTSAKMKMILRELSYFECRAERYIGDNALESSPSVVHRLCGALDAFGVGR